MDLSEELKKLTPPFVDEVVGICLFSGQPLMKSELNAGPGNFQFFYQTITVKYNGVSVKMKRRFYCAKTDELAKGMWRNAALKDLMNIELDFTELQDAIIETVRKKEIENQVRQQVEQASKPKLVDNPEVSQK